jgi:hypothetical protein
MRLIRNRGKDGWLLGFGKLDFGRKATKLRIRMESSAVSFQLSYSSSLVAPDLTSSTFWRRQMPAALMSIGLRHLCREPTATPAALKSLTQARERSSGKRCIPCRNELAPSSLSFWTFSLVSRPMPSSDQSDDDPNGTPE